MSDRISQTARSAFALMETECRRNSQALGLVDVSPGSRPPTNEPLTFFQSATLPAVSLESYAAFVQRYSDIGEDEMLVGIVLMRRYCEIAKVRPTAHMMHRLFVAALHVGLKGNYDGYFTNRDFASISGVCVAELNRLESTFCAGIEWRVVVFADDLTALRRTCGVVVVAAAASKTATAEPTPAQSDSCVTTDSDEDTPPSSVVSSVVNTPIASREMPGVGGHSFAGPHHHDDHVVVIERVVF